MIFDLYLFNENRLACLFQKAIDDVRISKGACPEQGNCNFEDATLCEYRNLEGTDLKWFARKGYAPNTIYSGNKMRKKIKEIIIIIIIKTVK